jgi:hypothetical protein
MRRRLKRSNSFQSEFISNKNYSNVYLGPRKERNENERIPCTLKSEGSLCAESAEKPLLKTNFLREVNFLSFLGKGIFVVAIFGKLSLFCHLGY